MCVIHIVMPMHVAQELKMTNFIISNAHEIKKKIYRDNCKF